MLLVALTGGIGAGKSSVSAGLASRGAEIVDADAIVRQLQAPGAPVFVAMVDRWGSKIVADDGDLDRQAVADIVFNDRQELDALNGMVHPAVHAEMVRQVEQHRAAPGAEERIVILDIPLLLGREDAANRGADGVIVVDCPIELAVQRLMAYRGFTREDAEARVANQIDREQRLTWADFVVDNSGDLTHLEAEIDRCWSWLQERRDGQRISARHPD
jgi:dephospho-CoA kinase